MFSPSSAVVALALASSAFAALSVTSPTATIGFTGGQPANITWMDSADQPPLANFGLAKVSIYAGNSKEQTSLQTISESVDVTNPLFLTFTPDASIGPNSGQYFIRFESLTNKDPNDPSIPLLAFSHVFTMSGMTGVFNAQVQSEIDGQSTAPIGGVAAATPSPSAAATQAPAANTSKASTAGAPKSSGSASNSAAKATASGSSAAVPTFVGGQNLWLAIVTGVFGAVFGAAVL
ncbi:hypothetical protein MVEN_00545200 [Mycena venus]|uniref:Yeast cell wall synthesis Kre9/Knh1-like N-terminal domain-containing protein n=1 Tax=Mycena venus TaxID=2733690 RepID=A0A8H6YQB7_9AGAR|nr:hypothetical protein MVEN_00545200 [Mycena venus]